MRSFGGRVDHLFGPRLRRQQRTSPEQVKDRHLAGCHLRY